MSDDEGGEEYEDNDEGMEEIEPEVGDSVSLLDEDGAEEEVVKITEVLIIEELNEGNQHTVKCDDGNERKIEWDSADGCWTSPKE